MENQGGNQLTKVYLEIGMCVCIVLLMSSLCDTDSVFICDYCLIGLQFFNTSNCEIVSNRDDTHFRKLYKKHVQVDLYKCHAFLCMFFLYKFLTLNRMQLYSAQDTCMHVRICEV